MTSNAQQWENSAVGSDPKRRQKALARKAAKRKTKQKSGHSAAKPWHTGLAAASGWPLYECLINRDWREDGICRILIARQSPEGRIAAGFVALDLLQVHRGEGFAAVMDGVSHYVEIMRRDLVAGVEMVPLELPLAAKIIAEARAYAKRRSFRLCPELPSVAKLLGDSDPDACTEEVTFGPDALGGLLPEDT